MTGGIQCWSFYRIADGTFTGRRIVASHPDTVAKNTPDLCKAIEGRFDPLSQRVDIETGKVIDYQPPAPDSDHLWSHEAKRWRLKPEVAERKQRQAQARTRIAELELAQLRPHRELFFDPDNAEARRRLQEIESEIAELRGVLTLL